MENLSEILKRMRESRRAEGDESRAEDGAPNTPEQMDVCPICNGRMWLLREVAVGHPDFGRAYPCSCQVDTPTDERGSRLRRYSNLGPLSRKTFDSLAVDGKSTDPENRSLFRAAYHEARSYAEEPRGWLVFTGPNGSGKTHLAAAIANRCIERGSPIFFIHVPDLLDDLRSTYAPSSEMSYSELFDQVNDAPLLVLDGLGSHSPTLWAQEKLQQIFNRRASSELPTVITTARAISELDPYISSRITDPDLSRVVQTGRQMSDPAGQLGIIPLEMIERMAFAGFDPHGRNCAPEQQMSLQAALDASRSFAADPSGWLTLTGDTGVGKTHLAVAIAAERLEQGRSAFFAFVPELMDYLRHTFQPNSVVAYDQVFDHVKNAPLLVLDDLSDKDLTDWAYDKIYQVFVHRHNLRLPTVITSPMNLAELAGPISSRIRDPEVGILIRMDAEDYRNHGPQSARFETPEHVSRRRR